MPRVADMSDRLGAERVRVMQETVGKRILTRCSAALTSGGTVRGYANPTPVSLWDGQLSARNQPPNRL
jgi:hypothetical protein